MSTAETWTVGKLLTWTTDYLKQHGSPSPRLDAEVLLAHARQCQRIELYTAFGEEPDETVRGSFRDMVRQRAAGKPVAYLVGHKEFYASDFEVTPDVLIPRPETEHLIVETLDRAKQLRAQRAADNATSTPAGHVASADDALASGEAAVSSQAAAPSVATEHLQLADVGTGSGIIAISLAKHLPGCRITAIDISPAALAVAGRNAARLEIPAGVIEFVQGDLFDSCPAEQRFDLIVSNPPYVSAAEYEQLDKSVREFEPRQALLAGPTGAEVIVRLLQAAATRLAADGWLLFEFSPWLAPRLGDFVGPDWQPPIVTKDFAGHPRVVALRRSR